MSSLIDHCAEVEAERRKCCGKERETMENEKGEVFSGRYCGNNNEQCSYLLGDATGFIRSRCTKYKKIVRPYKSSYCIKCKECKALRRAEEQGKYDEIL